jgi:hypothetical protein
MAGLMSQKMMDHDEKGGLSDSRELIILEKEQQVLLEAILKAAMTSEIGREAVKQRLGSEYVEIGLNLLRQMTGE